ncbi:MAG: ABC transporter substrate-binding protein [Anaerolineae bacterium]
MSERHARQMIALLFFLVAVSTSCSGLMATPEPVTISFIHPVDPSGAYEQWAQQFQEEHPHITVELVSSDDISFRQYTTKDAFIASQFELTALLDQQSILDLSSFIEQAEALDVDDIYPAAMEVFKSQGRQWALPFGVDMMMIYYNKDLFDRYGVAYPWPGWTWGDFLDRALDTTDPGADIYGYAIQHEGDFSIFEPLMLIYQHGGRVFDSLQAPTVMTLNDPLNVEAMEYYASWINDHGIAPTAQEAQSLSQPYPWRGVLEGQFAMWTMMYSERGGLRWPQPWRMNWGVVPMARDTSAAALAMAEGLYISSSTEHPEEAWAWIQFLSQQLPSFTIPARQSVANSERYEQVVGPDVAATARAALDDAILVNPELLGFEQGLAAMAEAFAQIRSGEPVETALDEAQRKSGF